MNKIKVAIVGIGNCASSLVQGIQYYSKSDAEKQIGLMHWEIGGHTPADIEVVAAFDIDKRKVGKDLTAAIFSPPNCSEVFCKEMPLSGVEVSMGQVLDGYSEHMNTYDDGRSFVVAKTRQPDKEDVVQCLKKSGAEILISYLPVGSEKASHFYAECAIAAGTAFINNIPVFIASNPDWAARFKAHNLPVMGDDIKSQLGATITHRMLTDLFHKRGVKLERTYQLNTGGNTDFLNMLNRARLKSKKESKTEAVQSVAQTRLESENIHIGPSDYVPWQNDNKICFIRMEGKLFGGVPMELELRLSVQDSPNSAGVVIDAIRCCRLALDRNEGGVLHPPSAYFFKHPPIQYTDDEAYHLTEAFIQGSWQEKSATRIDEPKTIRLTAL